HHRRNLLGLPSVLHRQDEVRRYHRPRREVPAQVQLGQPQEGRRNRSRRQAIGQACPPALRRAGQASGDPPCASTKRRRPIPGSLVLRLPPATLEKVRLPCGSISSKPWPVTANSNSSSPTPSSSPTAPASRRLPRNTAACPGSSRPISNSARLATRSPRPKPSPPPRPIRRCASTPNR